VKNNRVLSFLSYVGEKKWRAYCFWYLIGYLAIVWHVGIRRGDFSLSALFPLKILPVYISIFFAPVNYKAVRGQGTQEWVLRRSFKLGIGFIVLLVTVAIFEKTFQTGWFLYIW